MFPFFINIMTAAIPTQQKITSGKSGTAPAKTGFLYLNLTWIGRITI